MSAVDIVSLRHSGELGATELVLHFLSRIEDHNDTLNALVTVIGEQALDVAHQMDERTTEPGILWGLPFADKDLTQRAGVPTGFGSRTMKGAPLPTSSDPIAIALDNAGGISLGKTAVCEFGFASYTESQVFPPTRNPYSLDHGAGGSSGGAAAAVAGRLLPCAPGTDGGGSVRIPAWTCGLVGLKPSRGLIPGGTGFDYLAGLVVPGPLARTVGDAALLLDAMVGEGRTFRATGHPHVAETFSYSLQKETGPLRVGVTTRNPWESFTDTPLEQGARTALERVISELENSGHHVVELGWEPRAGYPEAFTTIWRASAVLLDVPSDGEELLEPLTRYLVDEGKKLSARDIAGALRELSAFEEHTIRSFSAVDVVLTPGLATSPPRIGFYDQLNPERNFEQQVQVTPFSSFVNVAGLPALALPVMLNDAGLPVGVQLIGQPGADHTVLRLGLALERQLQWSSQPGPLW